MIKDTSISNHPDTVRAMVGEKITGVICDHDGRWHLIVESGHAFVMGGDSKYWIASPKDVQGVINRRKANLVTWQQEALDLMAIPEPK